LQRNFTKIGDIEYVHIIHDSQKNQLRRFGFIKFMDEKSAVSAVDLEWIDIGYNIIIQISESISQKEVCKDKLKKYEKNHKKQSSMDKSHPCQKNEPPLNPNDDYWHGSHHRSSDSPSMIKTDSNTSTRTNHIHAPQQNSVFVEKEYKTLPNSGYNNSHQLQHDQKRFVSCEPPIDYRYSYPTNYVQRYDLPNDYEAYYRGYPQYQGPLPPYDYPTQNSLNEADYPQWGHYDRLKYQQTPYVDSSQGYPYDGLNHYYGYYQNPQGTTG
jgi:hypothetical protein